MTRDEITNACLESIDKYKCTLLQLSTGVGKTAMAIDSINKICDRVFAEEEESATVLIVVDKKVHIVNWRTEIKKWGGIKTDKVVFCCYASLHKHMNEYWDVVCLDEVHHVGSDTRLEALSHIHINHNIIGLSATIGRDLCKWFKMKYSTNIIKCSTQDAIDADILPDPEIWLVPLKLDWENRSELFIVNKPKTSSYEPIIDDITNLWVYKRNRKYAALKCTPRRYVKELDALCEWYKNKAGSSIAMKNLYLHACGERLKYLAKAKNSHILGILKRLNRYRTITFCASIEQSKVLGKNCIHSKNKLSQTILDKFNDKKIKHITSCNMLNESVNLTDCKYGIFANINASECIQIQRIGRSLRHKKPIVIIPFFRETREEEIVRKWMQNYNKDLIKVIQNIEEI